MGLTYYDARRLWEARLAGVSFETILTCSHLQLFLHAPELEALRRQHRLKAAPALETPLANYQFGEYADRFWHEFLGAKNVETMDYSTYENASIVHDLNAPVPAGLHSRFDAVIEAGSLEHIFNFPVAMANLMRMVKPGGWIFLTTPANNLCGHGFYQFSPELIYRVFSPQNGFDKTSIVFLEASFPSVERTPMRAAYRVADPAEVRSRVMLVSQRPVLMVVESQRVREAEPFSTPPQQSDYVAAWEAGVPGAPAGNRPRVESGLKSLARRVYKGLPAGVRFRIEGQRERNEANFNNQGLYQKLVRRD